MYCFKERIFKIRGISHSANSRSPLFQKVPTQKLKTKYRFGRIYFLTVNFALIKFFLYKYVRSKNS